LAPHVRGGLARLRRWRRYAHAGGATAIIVGGIPGANSSRSYLHSSSPAAATTTTSYQPKAPEVKQNQKESNKPIEEPNCAIPKTKSKKNKQILHSTPSPTKNSSTHARLNKRPQIDRSTDRPGQGRTETTNKQASKPTPSAALTLT